MVDTVVLVHSPLVGPAVWRPLAVELAASRRIVVPDFRAALRQQPPYYPLIATSIVAQASEAPIGTGRVVLIAHSGAGALLPRLAASLADVTAVIFVDALLPHPGKCWFDTVPVELRNRLLDLVRDESLPPWHTWWPQGAIEGLLGKNEFHAFIAELDDLPLAYFWERAPALEMPVSVRSSYLQLSAAYAADADAAVAMGWRVRRLDLHHLAMATHAAEVSAAILELMETD